MDRKSSRKRTMASSASLVSLKKMELESLKENYLEDDVASLGNVHNVVDMMQKAESTLNHKYDQKKAGLQRSVEMRDAQNDLAQTIGIAS